MNSEEQMELAKKRGVILLTSQNNTIMKCMCVRRDTGVQQTITPDIINYDPISLVLVDKKFCTQRQMTVAELPGTFLVYFTGSLLSTGTRSLLEAYAALTGVTRMLRGYQRPDTPEFVMADTRPILVVSDGMFPFGLNIDELYYRLTLDGYCVRYSASLFPGLRMWFPRPTAACKPAALIFGTGKVIITGVLNNCMTFSVAEQLSAIIMKYPSVHVPLEQTTRATKSRVRGLQRRTLPESGLH